MVKDPVCGMVVDPVQASQTRQAMGQSFYFCSNYCAEIFDPHITGTDLARLQATIGGGSYQTRLTPVLWAKGIIIGPIKKLIYSFGGKP